MNPQPRNIMRGNTAFLLFLHKFMALACIVGPFLAYQLAAQGFFFGGRATPSVNLPTPTAYWGFESNALDYASTNHLTTNGSTMAFSPGVRGKAGSLSQAVGSWLTLTNASAIASTGTSRWHMTGWVRVNSGSIGGSYLFGKGGVTSGEYFISAAGTNTTFGAEIGGAMVTRTGPWPEGEWFFFSAEMARSFPISQLVLTINANPRQLSSGFGTPTPGTNQFVLGRSPDSGLISTFEVDELAFFNGTNLNGTELATLYNSGYGRTYTNSLGWR
jgi:hypothetical protein